MKTSLRPLTWVEISRSALRHNARVLKKAAGTAKLIAVVKSNAYGHGIAEVVSVLAKDTVIDSFAVATLDEALGISAHTKKPIHVLSIWQQDRDKLERSVRKKISLPVYEWQQALQLNQLGRSIRRRVPVNVKIDVGTMRLGFRYDCALAQYTKIRALPWIRIEGLFSHFADSENSDETVTLEQVNRFDAVRASVLKRFGSLPPAHIACSAAVLRSSRYRYDAVRAGISLFGLWPSRSIETMHDDIQLLKPILSWYTHIIHRQQVKQGESIGYGLTYRASQNMNLAVMPIGYWDGYDRRLSNLGAVIVNERRCPIRGRICMNLSMLEVPRTTRVGQKVTLIGSGGHARLSADEIARLTDTINYEVVTRINPLIPRMLTV